MLVLNILCSLCSGGNFSFTVLRNDLPMLDCTLLEYGGLYHVMFLVLFLLFVFSCFSYFNSCWYPLFFNASWYGGFALLKRLHYSLLEISDSLLLIARGKFLMISGGWFDFAWTYIGILLGFVYGAKLFLEMSKVTSRKFLSWLRL